MKSKVVSSPLFRIRLTARLKNDELISAREKIGMSQRLVAAVIGITGNTYGQIERMQYYPSEDLQRRILEFYNGYDIILNSNKVFPSQLGKIKLKRKYEIIREISADRLLPLSTLDKKLLLPVEIDDQKIREEDLKNTIEYILDSLPRFKQENRMSDILRMHFGLSPYENSYNIQEVSEKYKITKNRVYEIIKDAIIKLRHNSRTKHLRQFLDE